MNDDENREIPEYGGNYSSALTTLPADMRL